MEKWLLFVYCLVFLQPLLLIKQQKLTEFYPLKLTPCMDVSVNMPVINNIGRMLLLGLPRKQNGHPIGYVKLLLALSPLKRGVEHV